MIDHQNRRMLDKTKGDATPTCRLVPAGNEFAGKQGHLCAPGISAQSAGARGIHLQIVRLPPGNRSKAHKHDGHETAIYILGGESGMWYGEKLEQHLVARAGDFLYIPANMPHLPYNLSDTESWAYGISAHTAGPEEKHESSRSAGCLPLDRGLGIAMLAGKASPPQ